MRKTIILLLLIFSLTLPTFAQGAADTALPRVTINGVELLVQESGAVLEISGTPATCNPVIVEQRREEAFGTTVISVDLFTAPAPEDAVCNFFAPFTQRVEIGTMEADQFYTLLVNDFGASVFVPRKGGTPMDILAQIALWDEPFLLEAHFRADATLEQTILSVTEAGTIAVQLIGYHGDGCGYPLITRLVPDRADARLITLEAFRVMPMAAMCPAMIVNFDEVIDTGLSADQEQLLRVGDTIYQYTPADQQFTALKRAYNQISAVEISAAGSGYEIRVSSEQGGECGAPLQELVEATEYATLIEIFNDIAPDAPCTRNIVLHQLSYTVSQLPVIINGLPYGLEDQSTGAVPQGDNLMRVNHVIENVNVLVLESFPMQLVLQISGYQPDGCQIPVQVEQQVEGNQVSVQIFREMAADAICPMVVGYFDTELRVEGSFSGGTVAIQVNEVTTSIDL